MPTHFLVEELIINDSFINYCYRRNDNDMHYWDNYVLIFPEQKSNIEEARAVVLGISTMFNQQNQESALVELKEAVAVKYNDTVPEPGLDAILGLPRAGFSFKKYIGYAAALAIGAVLFFLLKSPAPANNQSSVKQTDLQKTALVYETNYGEKKTVWLPDSSKVILNAKSTLRTDNDFGITNRNVYLTGEALFDVTYNEKAAFIVTMSHFKVKVLGTLFNVKAYPEDKIQETSLIRGKVEVILDNKEGKNFFLKPNEKAIILAKEFSSAKEIQQTKGGTNSGSRVTALTTNSRDNSIVETSWVYDRLDIYDKPFSEITADLERLYNVNIEFKDRQVANYRFSATFEKETIDQILTALQLSYPFHYTIGNGTITISK